MGGVEHQGRAEQREKPAQVFLEAFCPTGIKDIWPKGAKAMHKFDVDGKIEEFHLS